MTEQQSLCIRASLSSDRWPGHHVILEGCGRYLGETNIQIVCLVGRTHAGFKEEPQVHVLQSHIQDLLVTNDRPRPAGPALPVALLDT